MAESLPAALARIGALKFGKFTLKSGIESPFYIDMRLLVSYPDVLELAANALAAVTSPIRYDRIAAIPYGALPIGVALSMRVRKPLIFPRKERKEYGTGRQIEGEFNAGERILLVDDIITKGDSKLEALTPLTDAGLNITDIAVLLDRESGGTQILIDKGYHVHSVLTITSLAERLYAERKIEAEQRSLIFNWLEKNR
jgi:uridine monophosphate synthetase